MKVLYVYDKMPNEYEKYISVFFDNLKNKINVKTLVYEKNTNANYNIISYGFFDLFQRLLYKLSIRYIYIYISPLYNNIYTM